MYVCARAFSRLLTDLNVMGEKPPGQVVFCEVVGRSFGRDCRQAHGWMAREFWLEL